MSLNPSELIITFPSPSFLQVPLAFGAKENPLIGSCFWSIGYSIFSILRKNSKNKKITKIKKEVK